MYKILTYPNRIHNTIKHTKHSFQSGKMINRKVNINTLGKLKISLSGRIDRQADPWLSILYVKRGGYNPKRYYLYLFLVICKDLLGIAAFLLFKPIYGNESWLDDMQRSDFIDLAEFFMYFIQSHRIFIIFRFKNLILIIEL